LRRGKDLSLVCAVDEVDDVTTSLTEGHVGHGESSITGIEIAGDRESTVEESRIGVGDGNIYKAGITRGGSPIDEIGTELDPEVLPTGSGDTESQRTGGETQSSNRFNEHF